MTQKLVNNVNIPVPEALSYRSASRPALRATIVAVRQSSVDEKSGRPTSHTLYFIPA